MCDPTFAVHRTVRERISSAEIPAAGALTSLHIGAVDLIVQITRRFLGSKSE